MKASRKPRIRWLFPFVAAAALACERPYEEYAVPRTVVLPWRTTVFATPKQAQRGIEKTYITDPVATLVGEKSLAISRKEIIYKIRVGDHEVWINENEPVRELNDTSLIVKFSNGIIYPMPAEFAAYARDRHHSPQFQTVLRSLTQRSNDPRNLALNLTHATGTEYVSELTRYLVEDFVSMDHDGHPGRVAPLLKINTISAIEAVMADIRQYPEHHNYTGMYASKVGDLLRKNGRLNYQRMLEELLLRIIRNGHEQCTTRAEAVLGLSGERRTIHTVGESGLYCSNCDWRCTPFTNARYAFWRSQGMPRIYRPLPLSLDPESGVAFCKLYSYPCICIVDRLR